MGAKSSRAASPYNTGLCEDDLGDLCEVLYTVRKKYRFLGLRIGVSISEIDCIEASTGFDERLLEVLKRRLKMAEPLTWADIDKALRSQTVGEHRVANEIQERFGCPKKNKAKNKEKCAVKSSSVEFAGQVSNLEKVCQNQITANEAENIPFLIKEKPDDKKECTHPKSTVSQDEYYSEAEIPSKEIVKQESKSEYNLECSEAKMSTDTETSANQGKSKPDLFEEDKIQVESEGESVTKVQGKKESSCRVPDFEESAIKQSDHPADEIAKEAKSRDESFASGRGVSETVTQTPTENPNYCAGCKSCENVDDEIAKTKSNDVPGKGRDEGDDENISEAADLPDLPEQSEVGGMCIQSKETIKHRKDSESRGRPPLSILSEKMNKAGLEEHHQPGNQKKKECKVTKREKRESSASSTDNDDSSPECDMTKNISVSERKGLKKVFQDFFGRLCFVMKTPVETATHLQKNGLVTQQVMIELLMSPESEQIKAIWLVNTLQELTKKHPHKIFKIVEVLHNQHLQEIAREMWTEISEFF